MLDRLGIDDVDLSPVPDWSRSWSDSASARRRDRLTGPYVAAADREGAAVVRQRARRAAPGCSPPTTRSIRRSSRRWRSTPRPRTCSSGRAPSSPTAPACAGLAGGSTRASSFARRWRRSRRLGAIPWVEQASAELAATGETARRRDVSTLDQLTARELQVALLLSGGLTTRVAAGQLFLSPKTVEYHLRHVYQKLGIGSRSELAAIFQGGSSVVDTP